VLFIVLGLWFMSPQPHAPGTTPEPGSFILSVSLLFAVFSGFDTAFIVAGEVRNPRHNLLIALPIWLAIVATTYILIQVVCIRTLPGLAGSERPLADASKLFLGAAGASFVVVGMLVSAAGTLTGNMLSGSRVLFAMAEHKELPRSLAKTHPHFHTPWAAILFYAFSALLLALPGTFVYLITISAISRLTIFAATCASLPILRRREGDESKTFHLPAGIAVSILAFSFCVVLIVSSGWRELRDVAIAVTTGMFVYIVNAAWKNRRQAQGIKDSLKPLIVNQAPY
jgi:amino acid transporter